MEEWRSVPGLDPAYQVSNLGGARVLDRLIPGRIAGCVSLRRGKILRPYFRRYYYVNLAGKTRLLHRLILTAFRGPPPFPEAVCRHLDGNTKHNTLDNLAWGTGTENQFDRFDHGTAREGENNYRAVLTAEKVRRIMELRHLRSPKLIGEIVGCDPSHVKSVSYGQSWNWLTGLPRVRYPRFKNIEAQP